MTNNHHVTKAAESSLAECLNPIREEGLVMNVLL